MACSFAALASRLERVERDVFAWLLNLRPAVADAARDALTRRRRLRTSDDEPPPTPAAMDAFPRDVADAIRDAEAFVDARHATWREEHANARDATRAKASKIVAAAMFEQACAAAAEAFAERESRRRAASLTAEEEEEKRAAAAREARRVARAEERKRIADAAKAKAKSKSAAEAAAEAAHRRAEEDARRREARENAEGKRVREDSGDEDESTNRVVASDANADAKVKIEAEKGTEPATKSDGFVASASDRELAGVSRSESEAGFDGDYESDDLRGAGWIVAGSSRRAGSTGVSSARRRREDRRGELETRRVDGSLVGGVSGEDGRPVARRTSRVATTRAPPPMSRTAAAAAAAEKRRSEAAEKRRSEANSTGTTENDSATKPEPILARSESDVRDSGVAPAPGPSWAARASGETRSTKASATFRSRLASARLPSSPTTGAGFAPRRRPRRQSRARLWRKI